MRIGITGHQRLRDDSDWQWVEKQIDAILGQFVRPQVGITSLAIGADQLFAKIIIRREESLKVVVPFPEYEQKFSTIEGKSEYRRLLGLASMVEVLTRKGPDEEAYLEAGKRVADLSDILIAVWNRDPAAGLGGTADVVSYARRSAIRVKHIDPILHEVRDL